MLVVFPLKVPVSSAWTKATDDDEGAVVDVVLVLLVVVLLVVLVVLGVVVVLAPVVLVVEYPVHPSDPVVAFVRVKVSCLPEQLALCVCPGLS
jgi:hypothetical protein